MQLVGESGAHSWLCSQWQYDIVQTAFRSQRNGAVLECVIKGFK